MNKDILRNYFLKNNSLVALILIPCIFWLSIGLWVCYITSAGVAEVIAILFPPFILLLTYTFARRHMLMGGLILLIEGISLTFMCIKFLSVIQNIIFQALFVLPLMIAALNCLSSIRIKKSLTYNKEFIGY